MDRDFGVNQALVEELFLKWAENPASVDDAWRSYFDRLPMAEWPRITSAGAIAAPPEAVPAAGGGGASRERERDGNGNGRAAGRVEFREATAGALMPSLPPTAEVLPFIDRRTTDRRASFSPTREVLAANELQGRVSALVNAYRVRGHLFADLDPLGLQDKAPDELFLERYGLAEVDEDTVFATGDLAGPPTLPLREIVRRLRETYSRTIGVEFTFLEDPEARRWLQRTMESTCNHIDLSADQQLRILTKLTDAEIFEQFLHTNFRGAKRFSLEGAESFISMLDLLIEHSADYGAEEIVIGMAHRGRLNVLANILQMNVREIFAGFRDENPENHLGRGDVKYHLGYSNDRLTSNGKQIHISLAFNPSHLEFVNPVVEGRVRAKQDRRGDHERHRVLPLLVHGDASFAGQGIVPETLNLSEVTSYSTGGTVHVVINNQIGFTTVPGDARSTRYCTDVTRMLRCPVFHVNGEDPEAVAQVVRLATAYRQRYHKDVVIDLYCYRKYGHNEADEPRFTQPLTYGRVDDKRTVRQVYVENLVTLGEISQDKSDEIMETRRRELEAALEDTRHGQYDLVPDSMRGVWRGYKGGSDEAVPSVETAVPREQLEVVIRKSTEIPEGFRANKKIARLFDQRRERVLSGEPFDWGTAELMALGSLLLHGTKVRLSGQDSRRGTFSHRHAVIFDAEDGTSHVPLQHLSPDQGTLEVIDSPLSEAGCVGFEWGYSLDSPDALILWEAQFGDFVNGAQVIIDQFLVSSEDKWHRLSGLVLLLPHAFEGQGPEHSSARLERFLQLCAEDNIQVCNLTTPAQYFHALRRQILRPWRKPLVIMTPKSLLRHPRAVSSLDDLSTGRFRRILPDETVAPKKVRRVLFCSGKTYYDLVKAREDRQVDDVAIVRFEQLYPLQRDEVRNVLAEYPKGTDLVWVQEEPWNMGAWYSMNARLPHLIGDRFDLRVVCRPESASPATGSKAAHDLEQKHLMDEAFAS
ncbi:MAG: 2-oxoglutarate dehydrogenase E1 component [Myxococcota bacterium]